MTTGILKDLKEKADRGEGIQREEIMWVLSQEDPLRIKELSELANSVRTKFLGQQACIHGIIEMSNFCRRNCLYCGLRLDNRELKRYRLEPDEIVDTAVHAAKDFGYKMIVLQSGEDLYYSTDKLVSIIKNLRERSRAFIFLSIGERERATYEKLYLAGARGVLFRFETSSPFIFENMRPKTLFAQRIEYLQWMRDIGYVIATGPIIGLPGQTIDSYVADIMLTRELGALMVSTGPFIANPQTPLAAHDSISEQLMQKIIIAYRLALPRARIPVTTAMEYLWGDDFRKTALRSGANAFMLNLTPANVRDYYDIYPGKNRLVPHLNSREAMERIRAIVKECGMSVCRGFGVEFELTATQFAKGCSMS